MYRLNRYNDARDDANWYITLKDDASPANVTYIDEYFDYSWMEENDFRELVGTHTIKYGAKAGQTASAPAAYQAYLLALLEKYEEEEIADKKIWLNERKKEYANLSALDLATDARLRASLKENLPDANIIVVAQRVGTILNADQIIVLSHGKIMEEGSHAELLEQKGRYYDLYRMQFEKERLKNG